MIRLKRGVWQQSLTVDEPDDYGAVSLTKSESERLTRFVQKFCPLKNGKLNPQRTPRGKP